MIYMLAARQSYKRFAIASIGYIKKGNNPVDDLSKVKYNNVLKELFVIQNMMK